MADTRPGTADSHRTLRARHLAELAAFRLRAVLPSRRAFLANCFSGQKRAALLATLVLPRDDCPVREEAPSRSPAMPKQVHDDNFEGGVSMSFGDHLEELRKSLFKALAGLVVTGIIGFIVADRVVKFFQQPLERAMTTYLRGRAADK